MLVYKVPKQIFRTMSNLAPNGEFNHLGAFACDFTRSLICQGSDILCKAANKFMN
jgi:hypothetical protein